MSPRLPHIASALELAKAILSRSSTIMTARPTFSRIAKRRVPGSLSVSVEDINPAPVLRQHPSLEAVSGREGCPEGSELRDSNHGPELSVEEPLLRFVKMLRLAKMTAVQRFFAKCRRPRTARETTQPCGPVYVTGS